MLRRRVVAVAIAAVAVVAVVGSVLWGVGGPRYELRAVLPSAVGIIEGTPVQVGGRDAGRVTAVEARGDKAVVTFAVDSAHAPLPAGSKPKVEWRSLLGERFLAITPGSKGNPAIPDGSLIEGGTPQVTAEDLLETLDPPTREHLKGVVGGLHGSLDGREQDLNATVKTAGPAVQSLGSVLDAVGKDGPAIHELVTKLHGVSQVLAGRQDRLSGVVQNLGTVTENMATQQQQLSASLGELPPTLDAAKGTFDKTPPAVDSLNPLLKDLKPATAQLPSVTQNLSPVLRDLRPTVAQLRPTVQATNQLLDVTPGLLDSAHATVPKATQALHTLAPAVTFLRPYTPEAMGFLSQFGNTFGGSYDAQGHYAKALITAGQSAVDNSPPVALPGLHVDPRRAPGANAGQPWTDATGSGPR